MISWIKKQKYKIAIALCSILSIFTLFLGINKTYAYVTDTFSYSMQLYSDNQYTNEITLSNYTYNNIDINNAYIINTNSEQLYFNLNDVSNNTILNNYYFMINFYILDANNNLVNNDTSSNLALVISDIINYDSYDLVNILPRGRMQNNYMYTYIGAMNNISSNMTYRNNKYRIRKNYSNKIIIKNIDFVDNSKIGLSQYYDTYYGQIEENYNTLLDNYNDLQEDYSTLEGNYNTLQDNYDTLQEDYNDALTTINNASTIRQYLDFTNINVYISYNNNLNNLQLSFNQLIDNNILVNSSFYINRLQSYLITNNYITTNEPYFTMRINFDNSIVHLNWSNLQWYVDNDNLNTSAFTFEMDDTANNETYTAYVAVDSGSYAYDVNTFLNHQIGSNFTYIYDDIISIEEYYNNLMSNDFVITCQSQYADGYNVGYTDGLNTASRNYQQDIKDLNDDIRALQEANQSQYRLGYRDGYEVGSNEDISQSGFTTLLNSIMSYPVNMLRSVFNFEFMGINLFGVLTFFVSLGIVLFVIHRFKK